jgi:uncharacterized protein (DUF608 family)
MQSRRATDSDQPAEPGHFATNVAYDEATGRITDCCTNHGFPLGGMGTGGFNILTDGGFEHFRTNHNWFRFIGATKFPKGTFIAVRVKSGETIASRILRRQYPGGKEFANIEPIAHTTFTGKLPRFELAFEDAGLPASVALSGFSAIIPRDPKDSTLPVAFFTATTSNPSNVPIEVSFLFAFENILGLGGSGGSHLFLIRDGPVAYRSTRGNFAEPFECAGGRGVRFGTTQAPSPDDPRRRVIGEYVVVAAVPRDGGEVLISTCPSWSSREIKPCLFDEFAAKGEISQSSEGTKPNAGATCIKLTLAPGESRNVRFLLVWWTPYYVLEKRQRVRKITGRHAGIDYGHYYLNFFSSAQALAEYCLQEWTRLETGSGELEAILKESTLPPWLQTYVLNSADSMLISTCVPKDGSYYMIEGCPWDWMFGGLTGTLDQRLASHPYSAIFFPEFDRRELETFRDLTRQGQVPHGDGHCDIALCTDDVPYGNPIKLITPAKHWVDLPQSLILQIGKLFLTTGDWDLLRASWPTLVEAAAYLESHCVQHIPDGVTTYDYMYYHPHFIYSATLQLATLRMLVCLGNHLLENPGTPASDRKGVETSIGAWEAEEMECAKAMQDILWDGRGFFRTCEGRDSVFTSALAGDWIARYSGLGPVVHAEQAISHSAWQSKVLVESHDHLDLGGHPSRPLVYREASPDGREVPMRIGLMKKLQVNNPWQTIPYQALEAIYLGRVEAGLGIIKMIWEKGYYEGYPFNMDHWGFPSHIYMSHPSTWAVFNALSGAALDVSRHELVISPRLLPGQELFKIPAFFPAIWLWVTFDPATRLASVEVIKSFDEALSIQTLVCTDATGNRQDLPLDPSLLNVAGDRMEFKFPFTICGESV